MNIERATDLSHHRAANQPLSIRQLSYTLISTSTPLGNSSFINASTVLAVEL